MKILLLNQDWFAEELREAGHEVCSAGMANHLDHVVTQPLLHIDTVIAGLPNNFKPDVIIWLDNSAPPIFLGLEECDTPLVFYSVDTHHHVDLHSYIAAIFDHVFVAQRDYLPSFRACQTPTSWLPLWASRYVEASSEKRYGAVFIGNLNAKLNPDRVQFFEELEKLTPIHLGQGQYWDFFPFAEIVVNQTVKGDLNFRVFEAMMCGSLLLTETSSNGLSDIFTDGLEYVSYTKGDALDAARKIQSLLANPTTMHAIAKRGRDSILANHTAAARAKEILDVIANLKKRPVAPNRYFAAMVNGSVLCNMTEMGDSSVFTQAVIATLKAAEQALLAGEVPAELETAHLVIGTVRYEKVMRSGAGNRLLAAFSEKFPDNRLFKLAVIRAFLNAGDRVEAERRARDLSPEPPEVTFNNAENAVASLLDILT